MWKGNKCGLAKIVNCCGLIHIFASVCLKTLCHWASDCFKYSFLNGLFWGILHSRNIHHFKAQISQKPFGKYARSAAERLESVYPLPVLPNRLQSLRSLMQKNSDLCHFSQSAAVQSNQFTDAEVCRANS